MHGPFKDPYKVTEYGEKLGLGSRDYELVDVLPLEFAERVSMPYIAAHEYPIIGTKISPRQMARAYLLNTIH